MDLLGSPDEGAVRNEAVDRLIQAWLDENAAPELLPFEGELVSTLTEMVDEQQGIIDEAMEDPNEDAFTISLFQMEIDRVKYSLAKYLRVRLLKIEKCVGLLRADLAPELADKAMALRQCLSDSERRYLRDLETLMEEHLGEVAMKNLPGPDNFRNLGDEDMCRPPRTDRFVVCKVRDTIEGFQAHATAEPETWTAGSIYVVQYDAIRSFMQDGAKRLSLSPHFDGVKYVMPDTPGEEATA